MKGAWREPHNEQLHILCSSPDVVRRIKTRRMKWTGNMAVQRQGRVKAKPLRSQTSCYQFFAPFFASNVNDKLFLSFDNPMREEASSLLITLKCGLDVLTEARCIISQGWFC
jgi:hypothetical protein